MARARKIGDTSYNARRREYRAAQRYLKASRNTSGATAEKNRALAKIHLENALETYDNTSAPQKISSQIVNIGAALGIDVYAAREAALSEWSSGGTETMQAQRKRVIEKSKDSLAKISDEKRKELEAQALISNKSIGKRVMGGLVDLWRDKVERGNTASENRAAAQKAIFEYFHTSSWVDVLDKLKESIGEELFSIASDFEIYDVVKLSIQKRVASNTLVA